MATCAHLVGTGTLGLCMGMAVVIYQFIFSNIDLLVDHCLQGGNDVAITKMFEARALNLETKPTAAEKQGIP